jgi:Uncharacterized protein conserved in bacteria
MPAENTDHETRLQADISAERENDHAPPELPDLGKPSTIEPGLAIIAADGERVGTVAALEGNLIRLQEDGEGAEPSYIPVSLVSGVGTKGVLLSGRGDATFGEGAEP